MLKNCRKNNKGFTLLELLVVVLIIGILAGIALPKYQMAVMKSRYSTMMDTVKAIYMAEQRYYMMHDGYSAGFTSLDVNLSGCTLSHGNTRCDYDWGFCGITLSVNNRRVHCENTKNLKNAYVYYFDSVTYSNASYCWALTSDRNDKWNKLCENIGAVFRGSGTCTLEEGICRIYKF